MTVSIRYVQNTTTAANVNTEIGSNGKDCQLIAFDIKTIAGIAASANADVLTWTGSGKILSVISVCIKSPSGGMNFGATTEATSTKVTIDTTGKIIKIAVGSGGNVILANSTISILALVGNY